MGVCVCMGVCVGRGVGNGVGRHGLHLPGRTAVLWAKTLATLHGTIENIDSNNYRVYGPITFKSLWYSSNSTISNYHFAWVLEGSS